MQITPTKLSVANLLGTANEQYVIPPYQRRYSWREAQIADLYDDINLIEGNDTHLLGSIVCLTGFHRAGMNGLELVDGQQRITTLLIVMECIRERMKQEDEKSIVNDLDRLLSSRNVDGKLAPKLLLESLDADEFCRLAKNDLKGHFKNGNLATAFRLVREWIADEAIDDLRRFAFRLQNQAVMIRLDVAEAKDAFKLFEVINNRGLKLSPTDIVKNFLLGNAARFGKDDLEAARRKWSELVTYLDGVNSDTFLRYYLVARQKRRVTASFVVNSFKELFMIEVDEAAKLPDRHLFVDDELGDDEEVVEDKDAINPATARTGTEQKIPKVSFVDFLDKLVSSAKVYAELVLARTGSKKIDRALRNLRMIRAYQTYGFLMHLRVGGCKDKEFLAVLRLTESLMLRRQVCRERTNENDALFGSLCAVDAGNPVERTRTKYREACPSDDKFVVEFAATSYSANLMERARYCLERIELSLHGKHDELDVLGPEAVHVEHIVPQKIKSKRAKEEKGDWVEYLGPKAELRHGSYVGRIGNLTLFAGELNIGVSNNPFHRKRAAYRKSGIKLNASLAEMSNFRFDQIDKRSKQLAQVATTIWPIP